MNNDRYITVTKTTVFDTENNMSHPMEFSDCISIKAKVTGLCQVCKTNQFEEDGLLFDTSNVLNPRLTCNPVCDDCVMKDDNEFIVYNVLSNKEEITIITQKRQLNVV